MPPPAPDLHCSLQFWNEERPDWYALYSKRNRPQQQQQQEQDEGLEEGQNQQRPAPEGAATSSSSGGSWQPPTFSFTTLLRRWDLSREALQASRAAKQQRREAWMLQQYGGVRPETAEQQQLLAHGGGSCSHSGCRSCEAQHS